MSYSHKTEKQKESARKASRKYRETHKKQKNEYMKIWRSGHLDRVHFLQKKSTIKKRYGLTIDSLERLRFVQKNLCPICSQILGTGRSIHIDHNHKTGKVRAILHRRCNIIVGYIENNRENLGKILKYIGE